MKTSTLPGWVVFTGATLVASIFAAGTVGLLLLGRTVPPELWQIDIAVALAYFGAGPFSAALQHLAAAGQQSGQVSAQLVDTVNHGLAALRDAVQSSSKTAQVIGTPPTPGGHTSSDTP